MRGEGGDSARRGVASARDWTKGSIIRNLWSVSWPVMITQVLLVSSMVIDVVFVARLGAAPTAGVGVAGIVVTIVVAGNMGLGVGARAIIARFVGAGDIDGAKHLARQALIISGVYGGIMTAIGFFLAEPIMGLFGLKAAVVTAGAAYLRLWALAWTPMSLYQMNFSIMQGSGDTVNPMRIMILVRILHVLLDPCLIFGWWVFPRLGVSGAALTSIITLSLALALTLRALSSRQSQLRLTLRNFRLDLNIMWRILKIALPASLMGAQRSLSNLVLAAILAPFGTLAVAGYTLLQRVDMILFTLIAGLGIGAGVMVGQNLGAGQPERAERSGWLGAGIAEGIIAIYAVVVLLQPESIVHIFSSEPGLVQLTSTFLRIAVASYLAQGFFAVLQNSISGAGDTMPAMLFSLVVIWVVQLPLAFFLPQVAGLGANGVLWAIVAGSLVGAIAFVIYFRMGRWKRKRV